MLKKSFMVLLFLVVMLTSCAHDDEPDIYQEIGKGLPLQMPAANPPVVKGRVFVWTDYSFEYDSNGNPVYEFAQRADHPMVVRDNSVIVDVELK